MPFTSSPRRALSALGVAALTTIALACRRSPASIALKGAPSSATASRSAAPFASASVAPPPAPTLALRPEWTSATTMREPPYEVPTGVANVVAHVPEGFDDTQKLH